ncbi:hypothetical protein [Sporomusa sp.]|uniref:hypothetical protein n=1 Tax=Sporomusa sp. TaxID=2078658 RepID=UPI002BCA0105|nr:hypothetical protein [Sporomusa sp.]HWR09547.1 hypothetical protein [Sporomusa sp.]
MNKNRYIIILLVLFWLGGQPVPAAPAPDIVTQWSPVICQLDKSDGLSAPQNIFTLVNYDRDWRLNNNWYNLLFYPLERAMYYSVVESDSHYYISYYQYYPRHIGGGDHEHDLTGVLLAVSKTPDKSGRLDMLVTYSNNKWQRWDGSRVRLVGRHPVLNIRAASHEIAAAGRSNRALTSSAMYQIAASGNPTGLDNTKALQKGANAGYRLISLDQLWDRRQDIGQSRVFARWGSFDSYNAVKVTAPWVWEYRQLNWLTRPGELIQYFQGRTVRECNYLSNPYQPGM